MVKNKSQYNDEPVEYCKVCLSLNIHTLTSGKDITDDIAYCGDCGNSEVDSTHIVLHNRMYKEKYGKRYIDS